MVSTQPTNVTPERYEAWLDVIFGGAETVSDPFAREWDFQVDPRELAELFIATCARSGHDLAPYSDKAVAFGLQAMLFGQVANFAYEVMHPQVSVAQKVRVFDAMSALYADCLAKRAPPVLGHLSETEGNRLEYVTYMLWDVSPIEQARKQDAKLAAAFEGLLQGALTLDNVACVESALHGLGHYGGPARVGIIDEYLRTKPYARVELRTYAERAKSGMIQ